MISKSPKEGAQTIIHCAVSSDIVKYNGYYFSDCAPKKPSLNAMNSEYARRLWIISENLVNL